MLGFPLLYFKGMRLMMFQLSGFYCSLNPEPSLITVSNTPQPNKTALKPEIPGLGL